MSKKGGGGYDTSGLEAATAEANKLNREIWQTTRKDVQPWYNLGVGAVSRLADLVGVSGGSVQSRDQIYNNLKGQYTTTTSTTGSGNLVVAPDGRVYDISDPNAIGQYARNASQGAGSDLAYMGASRGFKRMADAALGGDYSMATSMGFKPLNTTGGQSTTDYAALNAAVDAQLAQQGTPDDYGSLLKRFSLEDYEADPGYQFRQQEAQKALENQMAAQGITLGGAGAGQINPTAYRAMNELTQNLASQEYGNAYNRYVSDQLNKFNMLISAAGMGQGSTSIMAGAGQNYANAATNNITSLASAQQNAQLAQASQPSMWGQLFGGAVSLASLF